MVDIIIGKKLKYITLSDERKITFLWRPNYFRSILYVKLGESWPFARENVIIIYIYGKTCPPF